MRVDNEKDNENGNGIKKHQKVGVNSNLESKSRSISFRSPATYYEE